MDQLKRFIVVELKVHVHFCLLDHAFLVVDDGLVEHLGVKVYVEVELLPSFTDPAFVYLN
jgi:hypothetical protein